MKAYASFFSYQENYGIEQKVDLSFRFLLKDLANQSS